MKQSGIQRGSNHTANQEDIIVESNLVGGSGGRGWGMGAPTRAAEQQISKSRQNKRYNKKTSNVQNHKENTGTETLKGKGTRNPNKHE